ncbi:MAG: hypothetical protein ACE14S_01265 [Candidatus Bathyarchaeia archaeon]
MSFLALPVTSAHTPPQTYPTFAYLALSPSPVGVGQNVYVIMWVSPNPPTAAGFGGDVWRDLTVTITKPDGTTVTLGPFNSDATGSTFTSYTPDQIGTYKFVFNYPGQVLSLYSPSGIPADIASLQSLSARLGLPDKTQYINDTFLPSSRTEFLTVTQEQVVKIPDTPLPTGYWTRPIYGQNSAWASVASNWLGGASIGGTGTLWQSGSGPSSPHILWTKPIETGGIVGNFRTLGVDSYAIADVGFYSGGSYEGRFTNSLIIDGRLYYAEPLGHSNAGAGYTCVDLKTGEVLWHSDNLALTAGSIPGVGPNNILVPSFGQLYDYESQNQHGVVAGMLWAVTGTTWSAYDSWTGKWLYNITNVPNGFTAFDNTGAIVRYVLSYNKQTRAGSLALWNNTQHNSGLELTPGGANASVAATTEAYQWRPNGKNVDMGKPYAYSWNVSINADLSGLGNPTIVKVLPGDIILGTSTPQIAGFFSVGVDITPKPFTIWALSDKPGSRGQLLWIKNYTAPTGISRTFANSPIDTVNRVFFTQDTETFEWIGYSLDTGDQIWGPVRGATRDFSYYGSGLGGGQIGFTAYGNLYTQGFGGEICAFSGKTGELIWKFNNTNSGIDTVWGYYPIFIAAIADGKIYAFNNEHSPNYPLYKGEQIYCIDAYNGHEVYRMLGWAGQSGGPGTATSVLADGVLAYYNYYDNSIYAVGKGPSEVTVEAPLVGATQGQGVTICGTVTDSSAGAKELVKDGKVNIVPAVADGYVGKWMEYLYMQQPMPSVEGVPVRVSAIDSNGNSVDIGIATSDASGTYAIMWTPPSVGQYKIVAAFEGSNAYGPSAAETALGVSAAPSATATPTSGEAPASATTATIIIVAVIIAILIGIVNLALILRKK